MCKYCQKSNNNEIVCFSEHKEKGFFFIEDEQIRYAKIDKKYFVSENYGYINFCPICGKKLREEKEGDV